MVMTAHDRMTNSFSANFAILKSHYHAKTAKTGRELPRPIERLWAFDIVDSIPSAVSRLELHKSYRLEALVMDRRLYRRHFRHRGAGSFGEG
jgi:phosphoribosyl-dephospho-CoA transferase